MNRLNHSSSTVAAAHARPAASAAKVGASERSPSARSTGSAAYSVATTSKTCYALTKAQKETERELQKHLQSLLQTRHRLRRAHDTVGKEYSTTASCAKELEECRQILVAELQRTKEMRDKTGSVEAEMRDHAVLVHGHLTTLESLAAEAASVLSSLTLADRQVQHLMVLVDRATDIDMQCLDGRIPDTVITNGSPLFPHLTVNDSDRIADEATTLAARAGRIAVAVRRSTATARGESTHSGQQLESQLATRAKLHAQAALGAGRSLEGLKYEAGRLQKQKSGILEELEAISQRLSHVQRTVALRQTAKDAIFAKDGQTDPVVVVMQRESKELQERRGELEQRLRAVNESLSVVERETFAQSDSAMLANHKTETFSQAATLRSASPTNPSTPFARKAALSINGAPPSSSPPVSAVQSARFVSANSAATTPASASPRPALPPSAFSATSGQHEIDDRRIAAAQKRRSVSPQPPQQSAPGPGARDDPRRATTMRR